MTTEATIDQLKQARSEGAVVLDVREPDEYAEGHVAGARSLPLSELPRPGLDLRPGCLTSLMARGVGRRSGPGLRRLRHLGFGRARGRGRRGRPG